MHWAGRYFYSGVPHVHRYLGRLRRKPEHRCGNLQSGEVEIKELESTGAVKSGALFVFSFVGGLLGDSQRTRDGKFSGGKSAQDSEFTGAGNLLEKKTVGRTRGFRAIDFVDVLLLGSLCPAAGFVVDRLEIRAL